MIKLSKIQVHYWYQIQRRPGFILSSDEIVKNSKITLENICYKLQLPHRCFLGKRFIVRVIFFSLIWLKCINKIFQICICRFLYENNRDVIILTNADKTVWQINVGVGLDLITDSKMFAWWHIYRDFFDKLKGSLNCETLRALIHAVKNLEEIETVLKYHFDLKSKDFS